MVETVSQASIIGMFFSLIISVGMPIGLLVWWKKKTDASIRSFFIGCMIFIVFAMVIEQAFHSIILALTGDLIQGNIILLGIYGGLCAGAFEETGRYIAMKGLMKGSLNKKNSIMYGIGHGGIEAILLIGMSYVSNLALAFAINGGKLPSSIDLSDAKMYETISAIWTTPSWMFFMAGAERVSAIILHIVLSYMVYKAVKGKDMKWYFIAVLVHMAVDTGTVFINQVVPVYVTEILLWAVMVALTVWLVKAYKAENLEIIVDLAENAENEEV